MKKRYVLGLAVASLALMGAECGGAGPGEDPSHVTERTTLNNMPGGEGPNHQRIRICVSGKSTCDTYPPSEVKNCQRGSDWPGCKED